jgi:hypothetical protein
MMEAVGAEAECRKAEVFEDVSCLRRRSGGAMNSMVTWKNTRRGAEKIARRSARARGPAPVVQLGQLAGSERKLERSCTQQARKMGRSYRHIERMPFKLKSMSCCSWLN